MPCHVTNLKEKDQMHASLDGWVSGKLDDEMADFSRIK